MDSNNKFINVKEIKIDPYEHVDEESILQQLNEQQQEQQEQEEQQLEKTDTDKDDDVIIPSQTLKFDKSSFVPLL